MKKEALKNILPLGSVITLKKGRKKLMIIGRIQEETHRFAITYHRQLRSKHVRGSALDAIEGIGEKRRNLLLRKFRSVAAIREADLAALRECLPQPAAQAVYDYFHSQE